MENSITQRTKGHIWAGTLLVAVGGLLFTRALGVPYPPWLFTWPVLLIAIGLFIGLRHGFRVGGWMIPILIGGLFLSERFIPGVSIKQFIAPAILMGVGLIFILRPRNRHFRSGGFDRRNNEIEPAEDASFSYDRDYTGDKRDFIDTTSVFGGIKKIVLSKNFKGGDLVNFMGGSEINLTQADFSGRIRIETTNVFGGTKLIVPPTWDVQSEVVAVFGGVDDKRQLIGTGVDPNKVLVIEGTCIFGGIEIRSF
jgi:predicted membrane protein